MGRAWIIVRAAGAICAIAAAGAAAADPPCVPGSIGSNGCLSIRPGDGPELRGEIDLSLPTDRRLALTPAERAALLELQRLRRMRPRGDSALPSITEPLPGRDPEALRRFQAPYRFD